jgi:hypothetical protein
VNEAHIPAIWNERTTKLGGNRTRRVAAFICLFKARWMTFENSPGTKSLLKP